MSICPSCGEDPCGQRDRCNNNNNLVGTCSACTHWEAPAENAWGIEHLGFGVCKACNPVFNLDRKIPYEIRDNKWDSGSTEEKYAVAMKAIGLRELFGCNDGSSYHASLETHPNFGCVRYKAKPKGKVNERGITPN